MRDETLTQLLLQSLLPDNGKVPNVVVSFAPCDMEVAAGFFAFVAPEDVLESWRWRLAGILLR